MTIQKTRRQRLVAAGLLAGAVATGVTTVSPSAQAAVDPVTVTAWIKVAQEGVKLAKSIFDLFGNDLTSQLETVRKQIVAEMRTDRNRALISNVNAISGLLKELANNDADDPVNNDLYVDILGRQYETATAMFDIIQSAADGAESSYQIAPAYNVLIHTGNTVLRTKEFINPRHPSKWLDYYSWLQPAMEANYTLVKSRRHQCWPGKNPGYRPQPPGGAANPAFMVWMSTTKPGLYKDSQLWTKKLANKNYRVASWTATCRGGSSVTSNRLCNPGTKKCTTAPLIGSGCSVAQRTFDACASGTPELACAESLAKPAFDDDAVVKVVRASMVHIQKLSGGNDFDWPSNNPLTSQGKLVDPWVSEDSCSATGAYAYPHVP